METKKSNRVNLENKKAIFLELGFILTLSLLLAAFEWATDESSSVRRWSNEQVIIEDLIPLNTVQPKPLQPPPIPKPVLKINSVPNDDPAPDDFPVIDAGITPDMPVPVYLRLPEDKPDVDDDTVFLVVEKMPEFPGGEPALYKFIRDNVAYPKAAKEAGIQGTVYVGFVIEKDGSISSLTIQRSPSDLLSEESVRVMSLMPRWSPGEQRGKPVRVSYSLPFKYTLQ